MKNQTTKDDIKLQDLTVLFLDCQTTGATPEKGQVLEIGWADNSQKDVDAKSYVLKLPEAYEIPRRVQAITGIQQEELDSGHSEQEVWKELLRMSKKVAGANGMKTCPTVIHYAKFEEPFLWHLHDLYSSNRSFPFRILCTHQIAKRLFPDLPRKGIRAVAGYLGHSVGVSRRCYDHALATAFIWNKIVKELNTNHNINTLGQLQRWISEPPDKKTTGRIYPMDTDIRRNLPDRPGVYRMLRSNGDVLYVGKATSLRQRVNSYFQKGSRHPEHILEMLSQAKKLDFTETGSALEAAILESDEIKTLSPPYNKSLRERERSILFCSDRFDDYSDTPSEIHRIGPFASREPINRLAALRQVVMINDFSDRDEDVWLAALGVHLDYGPDGNCLKSGFEIFIDLYREKLINGNFYREIIKIGRDFWIQRLAEKEMAEEENSEEEEKERVEFVWTPEAVAHTLERNILWGTYELRRSRWFTILSESSLAWKEKGHSEDDRRFVILEKGEITHRGCLDKNADVPIPHGHRKKVSNRRGCFDVKTWDRMRVLNTEIRRLAGLGNWINLRLSPSVVLEKTQLEKLFKWI